MFLAYADRRLLGRGNHPDAVIFASALLLNRY